MIGAGQVERVGVGKRSGAAVARHPTSLAVPSKTYCRLLGPSGGGKTSTLRMIAGPFGLLITFAALHRFDGASEEGARDLGLSPWQAFQPVVPPTLPPSVTGHTSR